MRKKQLRFRYNKKHSEKGFVNLLIAAIVVIVLVFGVIAWKGLNTVNSVFAILEENKTLKQSITRLTRETQIGYAKVTKQEKVDGKLMTTLLFVQTDPFDSKNRVLEKTYTIEGDVINFDALVIKFDNRLVLDGTERAIYIWRRVYGEKMSPDSGYPIEESGLVPKRYESIFKDVSKKDGDVFWKEVWNLANDPKKLEKNGITAVFGNVTYTQLRPELIYIFKINDMGGIFPETVPAL
jgi:hypothetical protein